MRAPATRGMAGQAGVSGERHVGTWLAEKRRSDPDVLAPLERPRVLEIPAPPGGDAHEERWVCLPRGVA